jgi:hypothetical protein
MADDDYVRQAATLARDTLDPKLFVWVEYSNELWNTAGGFSQSKWNQQKATEEFNAGDTRYDPKNVTVRGWQRNGKRTAEISRIFREVFAEKGQAGRVRVVLCGQSGYPEVVETAARWISQNVGPLNEHVYAVAVAPYFGSDKYWDKRTRPHRRQLPLPRATRGRWTRRTRTARRSRAPTASRSPRRAPKPASS